MHETIDFQSVKVGDRIFNSQTQHPAFQWPVVTAVRTVNGSVVLTTAAFEKWGHPREGIAVLPADSR